MKWIVHFLSLSELALLDTPLLLLLWIRLISLAARAARTPSVIGRQETSEGDEGEHFFPYGWERAYLRRLSPDVVDLASLLHFTRIQF